MAAKVPTPQKILVFGATGVIGKYIIDGLVDAKPAFEKIGLFTSVGTAQSKEAELQKLQQKGVNVIIGDVNVADDIREAYRSYDTVISALGRNVILNQIPLLDLAETSSTINNFYPSEYGTDIEYGASSANEKPHQLKLKVRAHIRDNIKKLKVTYLVTGPYSDLYIGNSRHIDSSAGVFDVKGRRAVLLGTGQEPVSFTTMRDVGKLLVAALKSPTPTSPRTLRVNSFTATPNEIKAEFEKQTGGKWAVTYTSLKELKEREKKAEESGSSNLTLWVLRRIWTEGGTLYDERDNAKIGEPQTESLESQVKSEIEKQKYS